MDPGTIIAVVETSVRVLSLIAKYYSTVKKAEEDIRGLKTGVEAIYNVLRRIQELVQSCNETKLLLLASLATPIESASSDIDNIMNTLDSSRGKKAMSRVGLRALQWPFTKKEVEQQIGRLEGHKTTLTLALNSVQASLILEIDENVSQLQQDQSLAEQDRQLGKLLVADGAAFDSFHRQHEPQCVQNTRVDLLRQVQFWNDKNGKCIFWLSGMAGTGKSTIARTVASVLAVQKQLGASFFFSRGAGDLGHATKFVSTLARQLASVTPLLKQNISQAIADHDNITRQGLSNQWKELILKPLSMLDRPDLALTLVIDALDECDREEDIKLILQLFVEAKDVLTVRLKVFITSRPETPIRLGFRDMPEIVHQDLILHDIPRAIVEHDICVFLRHELDRIRKIRNLPGDWPDEKSINLLVEKADCLFIYIATACRFIWDSNWRPQERLSLILESDATGPQLTAELDSMYMQILKLSVFRISSEKDKSRLSERFRRIIGSIVTLFDVLSTIAIAGLLDMLIEDVSLTLDSLHSVLNVPKEERLPIQILHPSFRDFLVNNERCDDNYFYINQELVHMDLAKSCLQLLFHTLKRDICNLRMPGTLIHKVQYTKIEDHLSKDVQYACRYWIDHLERLNHERRIKIGLHDDGQIHVFLLKHFLHWLEALSLMGKIPEGVLMIARLEAMLEPNGHFALKSTIYDAKRFILSNKSIIEEVPLQLYASALVFCPQKSNIKAAFLNELPSWITRYPIVEDNWSSSLQVLEGHTSRTSAVAFSSNDKLLASASEDQTIRLWDPATGTLRSTLEGHTDKITAAIFSDDGQFLATASADQSIRLWDPSTGTLRNTLEHHTDKITAVALSSDSQLLASVSWDRTVLLWSLVTGQLQSTLEGHTNKITTVAFSPNGKLLASASWDRTIRLWDLATRMPQSTLEGHTDRITMVAFSSNGQLLASASWDQTVRLWDLAAKTVQNTLKGHTDRITTLAFSSNSQHLASMSLDKTVRLWDAATGKLRSTLKGHTDEITAVAFSGDGQLLASASLDRTVRLWDAASGRLRSILEGHTGGVTTVAFSGDSQILASASGDWTVRLWSPEIGTLQSTVDGHTKRITSVAFSDDGQLLASGSYDRTVRLWDPEKGTLRSTLEGHNGGISEVAFSGDGELLASASWDRTVRLWNPLTGALRSTLKGHKDRITKIAFSGDGQHLASASYDQTVRLWDPAKGRLRSTLEGHRGRIIAVAFSGDGQSLASASWDQTIRLWDPATGNLRNTLEGHTGRTTAVAFSRDSQLLASASNDQTIRLWDPATGNLVQKLEAESITKLSFSADRTQLESNLGLIQLSNDADYTHEQSLESGPWMIQQFWVTRNNHKVLWLPLDFRPSCSAVRGNLIVIGHFSGRLIFLGLQPTFNQ